MTTLKFSDWKQKQLSFIDYKDNFESPKKNKVDLSKGLFYKFILNSPKQNICLSFNEYEKAWVQNFEFGKKFYKSRTYIFYNFFTKYNLFKSFENLDDAKKYFDQCIDRFSKLEIFI